MSAKTYWSNVLSDIDLEFIKDELQTNYTKGQTPISDSEAIRIAITGYAETLRKAKEDKESQTPN